jgi:hypothetical protein
MKRRFQKAPICSLQGDLGIPLEAFNPAQYLKGNAKITLKYP